MPSGGSPAKRKTLRARRMAPGRSASSGPPRSWVVSERSPDDRRPLRPLGLGLNIVVGYAGLLDLDTWPFFAIGSYTIALLTSPELGFFNSFLSGSPFPSHPLWGPLWGSSSGIPVLKMRGDYLRVAPSFGEIIRNSRSSDFLRPWLGGRRGGPQFPRSRYGPWSFGTPQENSTTSFSGAAVLGRVYFPGGSGIPAGKSLDWLSGRTRMWPRPWDQFGFDQTSGLQPTGAGFLSALSGAIFATKRLRLPHSFNVNDLDQHPLVIIVGGMGQQIRGYLGPSALVGLSRNSSGEFAEYRLLVYGAVLVAMMLLRPEGLGRRRCAAGNFTTWNREGPRRNPPPAPIGPGKRKPWRFLWRRGRRSSSAGWWPWMTWIGDPGAKHPQRDRAERGREDTFFNCVTGFYRVEAGEILFQGIPLSASSRTRSCG